MKFKSPGCRLLFRKCLIARILLFNFLILFPKSFFSFRISSQSQSAALGCQGEAGCDGKMFLFPRSITVHLLHSECFQSSFGFIYSLTAH